MKALFVSALLFAVSASAHAESKVKVTNFGFTGTGCEGAQAAKVDIAATGQIMFRFMGFEARTAPELDFVNKYCDMDFTFEVPAGYRIARSKFYIDGSGRVTKEGHGDIAVRYTVEGQSKAARVSTLQQGEFTSFKAYDVIDSVNSASDCPQSVDVSVQAEVFAERGAGEKEQSRVSLRNGTLASDVGLVCEVELVACHQ